MQEARRRKRHSSTDAPGTAQPISVAEEDDLIFRVDDLDHDAPELINEMRQAGSSELPGGVEAYIELRTDWRRGRGQDAHEDDN